MNPSIGDALEALRVLYLDGGSLALLFDYDGTLTPIVGRPELALLAPETRELLARLAALPRVHVGVVSGRSLDELKSLVDLPGLYYAGAAGMELELAGRRILHPRAEYIETATADFIESLKRVEAECPGAWVEDKRFACTVHYREAAEDEIDRLIGRIEELVRLAEDDLRIVEGPMAREISFQTGWHKGTAVRMILDHFDAHRAMLLYAGDGGNDADAYEAAAALAGITIGVGPHTPAARFRLADPAALVEFLSRLETAIGSVCIS